VTLPVGNSATFPLSRRFSAHFKFANVPNLAFPTLQQFRRRIFHINFFYLFSYITEDSFDDDDDADEDGEKSQRNQNYFCFIDPTKILLQNVNREFLGNYSCRGNNAAGWGDESDAKLLDVLYAPGNASISVFPSVPINRRRMVISCTVDDSGNPKSTRFHWLRGENPVKDIVTSEWTIEPIGLDSRNNFTCFATNDGGNGTMATINIDIQTPPLFIKQLNPYTGFLHSEPNIFLVCRVECAPSCSIYWFKDGDEITARDERYSINQTFLPASMSTGDFESTLSELVNGKSGFCKHTGICSINISSFSLSLTSTSKSLPGQTRDLTF